MDSPYNAHSFWHDTAGDSLEPRPPLTSDEQVDIAIIGAGFTGLWTAYYLKQHDPNIRVAIVEAEIAGFGASGRNGGWCLGAMSGTATHLASPAANDGVVRLQRAIFETVDEVGAVAAREGIDCHWQKGGNVTIACSEPQLESLRGELATWREMGAKEEDIHWLHADESRALVGSRKNLGGVYLAHCAALHPLRLVRGLAEVVEHQGAVVYEMTPAICIEPGSVVTPGGRLRAEIVIRTTEAYTGNLPGQARVLVPVHSMMIATEPLPPAAWEEIHMPDRVTFGDPRRAVTYGQRTADNRLAFGCRGNYFYGSGVHNTFSPNDPVFDEVRDVLVSFFPSIAEHDITHRWGGAFGAPRNWRPSVGFDRNNGLAWAGGYVGEGVAASNLAGRILTDLIFRRFSNLVDLPLVGPPFPRWEPEPFRWLGFKALRWIGDTLDAAELRGHFKPRIRNAIFKALVRM